MSGNHLSTPRRQRADVSSYSLPRSTSSLSNGHSSPTTSTSSSSGSSSTATAALRFSWRSYKPGYNSRNRSNSRRNRLYCALNIRRTVIISLVAVAMYIWLILGADTKTTQGDPDIQQILQPKHPANRNKKIDPERWIREHSDNRLHDPKAIERPGHMSTRPKAALISLVRNQELEGILQSMRQLEYHWNKRYRYPWIFFSEESFSDEFKAATTNATTAPTSYHLIPRAHWSTPSWVSLTRHHDSLTYLHTISVGKGHLPSYRHMCRWNSGFFYQHPALAQYTYYWRVEPDVHFLCDINYDPFRFLAANNLIYGFNMNILDDARSFASLWRNTRAFIESHPHLIHPSVDLSWLVDPANANEYNNCQFFSNFEIGSLDFFRGQGNTAYFRYLDEEAGGFFYERYGDAPIHTLSVAMFAPKDAVWFFRDIGYQHDIARHCPGDGVRDGRCACEPTGLDENFYKLVPMESPQRKPDDSCIRLWLGGKWLEKKSGWEAEVEKLVGGDGYGGYVRDVL